MADATTAATNAAAKVAASPATKAAITRTANEAVAKAVADQALPLIAETTELAVQVPSKVVLGQKTLFALGIGAGMVLAVGVIYGVSKVREYKAKTKVENAVAEAVETIQNPNTTKGNNPKS